MLRALFLLFESKNHMTNEITQQQIPLNKLDVAPENARKTNITARQDELKASLKAYGLLQPLLIRPADKKGRFFVVDGQRRLLALKALVKDKDLKPTHSVKCEQIDPKIAQELSLTANVHAETMHPADQFEAFFGMSQNKVSVGDIAARFGVSEKTVKQRLKLASISPKLLALYRDGEMSLEHLEAFTLSNDHEKQETLWAQLEQWQRHPRQIKAMLTEKTVSAEDPRVKLVTIEAYQKAGGHLERDLFSMDIYLTDVELLEKLIMEKIEQTAEALKAEGWSFVEVSRSYEFERFQHYDRIGPERVELSKEDAEWLDVIDSKIHHLELISDDVDNQDEHQEKIDTLDLEREQLIQKMEAYTKEQKESAGAYVSYHHGEIDIICGLVEKQDLVPKSRDEPKNEAKPKKEISERLLERLTAHKTLALQDTLSNSPQIAFDLMLTEMVKRTFPAFFERDSSCFHLAMQSPSFPNDDESLKDSIATVNREKAFEQWTKTLKAKSEAPLYEVVSSLKQDQKMKLLSFCFAGSFDAVKHPKEYVSQNRQNAINGLADLLKLDITKYWKPNASLYFNHIAKDNILNAVREVKGLDAADSLRKLKKAELAKVAEKRLENSNWLPKPLHVGVHAPDAS
ncbi:MAG: ParB/RepB/Spo0J family partition protein [Cyclobacteriaceae bacterium]